MEPAKETLRGVHLVHTFVFTKIYLHDTNLKQALTE